MSRWRGEEESGGIFEGGSSAGGGRGGERRREEDEEDGCVEGEQSGDGEMECVDVCLCERCNLSLSLLEFISTLSFYSSLTYSLSPVFE